MATQTIRPTVQPESHPPRPRRFTASEYDAIIEAGILAKSHQVELRDGEILVKDHNVHKRSFTDWRHSAAPDARHTSPYRFNVDEYMKMAEIGIFAEGERIELMDGEIIEMAPIGNPHDARTAGSNRLLAPLFIDGRAFLKVQGHIQLDDGTRPEPDLALLRWRDDFYEAQSPTSEDIMLLIEVSDSTLYYDRNRKLARYATSGIPEVWIENIPDRVIEAHRNPVDGEYTESRTYRPGETISPQAFPDLELPVRQLVGADPEQG